MSAETLREAAGKIRNEESSPFHFAVADWLDFEAEQIEDGHVFDVGGPADAVAHTYLGGEE